MTSWLSQHPIVVMGLWDGAKIRLFSELPKKLYLFYHELSNLRIEYVYYDKKIRKNR